ncbi:MAG: LysR family transcriptional regulator [Actinomycetota bacterium]|nr:LysR family transcriptional regulator [Actinomycetota bacterium]
MTIGQLRTFLAVAATGSVRAAAEQLVVTQPAVSAALAALQKEVGVALVEREGRGLRLTAAGRTFAAHTRRALGLLEAGMVAAAGAAEPERGRVRLAAVTTAGERLVPPLLVSFRAEWPDVEVTLEVGNRRRVWDLLAHHEVDLAIAGRPPATQPVVSLATRPHDLVVVAARHGPTAVRRVSFSDLDTATWLLRETGSGTRTATEEFLRAHDLDPPFLTLGSNGAIREAVLIGLGVTLVSRDAVAPELAGGALEEWRCPPLPLRREWHAATRSDSPLPPTGQLLLEHLIGAGWRRA